MNQTIKENFKAFEALEAYCKAHLDDDLTVFESAMTALCDSSVDLMMCMIKEPPEDILNIVNIMVDKVGKFF